MDAFLDAVRAIVGPTHCLCGEAAAPYLTDWRGRYTGSARAVAFPADTAEVAALVRVSGVDEAIAKANALPYGLAAFAFTKSAATAARFADEIESGMVSINHFGLAAAETPFGGIKDSGYGSEGGSEGLDAYQTIKFVSQIGG